jgi:hypothetical protein
VIADDRIWLDTRVLADKAHVAAEVGGELVMLNLETGEYHGMNEVASRIGLIQSETPVAAVRDQLLGEYPEVPPERITQDLLDVLSQLLDQGVIHARTSAL